MGRLCRTIEVDTPSGSCRGNALYACPPGQVSAETQRESAWPLGCCRQRPPAIAERADQFTRWISAGADCRCIYSAQLDAWRLAGAAGSFDKTGAKRPAADRDPLAFLEPETFKTHSPTRR